MERNRNATQGSETTAHIARFTVCHRPPWTLSVLFAVQHLLVQASLLQSVHYLLLDSAPSAQHSPQHGYQLMPSSLFSSGLATLAQASVGTRLPLVQAPTFEYLIPSMIFITQSTGINGSNHNADVGPCEAGRCPDQEAEVRDRWRHGLSQVRGAVVISGAVRVLLGLCGVYGLLSRHCGPMVLAPLLLIIGLSFYKEATHFSSSHWGISAAFIVLVVLLSQHFGSCFVPIWRWRRSQGFSVCAYIPLFRIFSLLFPTLCLWLSSVILRELQIMEPYPAGKIPGILNSSSSNNSSAQRVPWLKIPYPGEWGPPAFTVQAVCIGITMATATSISSMGCYIMAAKVLGCPHPPRDAHNRGISLEGLGSCVAAFLGSAFGISSSVPNVGALMLTQVQARRSVHINGLLCLLLGMSPKLTSFLSMVPPAIHGGMLSVTYTTAVAVGVSYFQFTDIDSGRNIFIIGFAVFMALLVPRWFLQHPQHISTGVRSLDIFILSLLSMPVIQGGILAYLLDNTVSGTLAERGLVAGFPGLTSVEEGQPGPRDSTNVYRLPAAVRRLLECLSLRSFPLRNLCPDSDLPLVLPGSPEEKTDFLPCSREGEGGGTPAIDASKELGVLGC
ncbi:solute carrier family 23 member 3 isoform X2 [Callorhinchus milii]|uniref:solute carrier family 23 member 3 isoform X2 n=1 Tax=Callorhinchus milii TaxID=7868 RepID=UPI001C3FDFB0|nr:solute carrier family 23 member 3 isoform X2 [Callorhinchus milii]